MEDLHQQTFLLQGFIENLFEKLKMFRLKKNKIIIFSISIYFILTLLPIFTVSVPKIGRYFVYMLILGSAMLSVILSAPRIVKETSIILILVLLFSIILFKGKWSISPDSVFLSYMLTFSMFWFPLVIIPVFQRLSNSDRKKLQVLFLVLQTTTLVTTIIGNTSYPAISRFLATNASTRDKATYMRMNIGSYELAYNFIILLPFLFYYVKESKKIFGKVFFMLFLVLIFYSLLKMEFAFAVILFVFILGLTLLFSKRRKWYVYFILILLLVAIFISRNILAGILIFVQDYFLKEGLVSLSDRMNVLIIIIKNKNFTGDALARSYLYEISWESFLASPLMGGLLVAKKLGGHSELLDILGATGIFGASLFLILLFFHVRNIIYYKGSIVFNYCLVSLLAFLTIAAINTVFTSISIGIALFLGPFMFLNINSTNVGVSTRERSR